jgi:hypothetical protein
MDTVSETLLASVSGGGLLAFPFIQAYRAADLGVGHLS